MITQTLTNILTQLTPPLNILTYTTVILTSILIFLKTNKYFKLSKYSGFKYLSKTFLYLTISSIFELSQQYFTIKLQNQPLTTLISLTQHYLFTLAIFYLIYSLIWKEIKHKNEQHNIFTIHSLSFLLSTITEISKIEITNTTLTILLIYTTTIFYQKYKNLNTTTTKQTIQTKNQFQLYFISLLIITFTTITKFITLFIETLKPITYLLTISAFLILLYLTHKKQN